jgi:hypothetical protein
MSNDQIGRAIKDAFRFLKPIFSDTARLMSIVEEKMKNYKMTALWGAASVWGRSLAYYGDYGWLTHYLNRLYISLPQKNEKPTFKDKKGVFFNLYFEPELLPESIVVYGAIESNDENIWPVWQSLFAVNMGPHFITIERVPEWAKYDESDNLTISYKVLPLVELNNQKIVESICDDTVERYRGIKS